jgi:dienelactone hydrolase
MNALQAIALRHEGDELTGAIALPRSPGGNPAVMVMHNGLGMDELMREKCRQLAQLGYVGVATNMYGAGHDRNDPASSGEFMMRLINRPELLRSRVVAWYERIKDLPAVDPNRIAAIGFCFGGRCVLELARSGAGVKAVVSYHGILSTALPAKAGAIKGHVAVYTGAKDPYAPPEHVDMLRNELNDAGANFQITVFSDACHAFTDPRAHEMKRPGIAYHAVADRISWAGTTALLAAVF